MILCFACVDDDNQSMVPVRRLSIYLQPVLLLETECLELRVDEKDLGDSPDTATLLGRLRSKVFVLRKSPPPESKGVVMSIRIDDSKETIIVKDWLTVDFIHLECPEMGRNGYYRARFNVNVMEVSLNTLGGVLEAFEVKLRYLQNQVLDAVAQYRRAYASGVMSESLSCKGGG